MVLKVHADSNDLSLWDMIIQLQDIGWATYNKFLCDDSKAQAKNILSTSWMSGGTRKSNVCVFVMILDEESRLDMDLLVAKSLLPGAGMGLFASRDFMEGETICRYESPQGTLTTKEAMQLEVDMLPCNT